MAIKYRDRDLQGPIPVTVGTSDMRWEHGDSKATTITSQYRDPRPIAVTGGILDTRMSKSDDAYRDRDPRGLQPGCDTCGRLVVTKNRRSPPEPLDPKLKNDPSAERSGKPGGWTLKGPGT